MNSQRNYIKKMWKTIGPVIIDLAQKKFKTKFSLKKINRTFIVLVPKKHNVSVCE